MAASYVAFVTLMIYGSTIHHYQWVNNNPSPTGLQWFAHHVDTMLAEYEKNFVSPNNLPPVIPWWGVGSLPKFPDPKVPAALQDPSGMSEEALGAALRNFWNVLVGDAFELAGLEKAPFSYRYWGYMKWAWTLRERIRFNTVIPEPVLYDRDGTILSPIQFLDTFNNLHRYWHEEPRCSPHVNTPGYSSTVAQYCGRRASGLGADFMDFHKDVMFVFHRWFARTGQPPTIAHNYRLGWPQPSQAANDPSTWTEPSPNNAVVRPFINDQGQDTDLELKAITNTENLGGAIEPSFHAQGHNMNSDIRPPPNNIFVPRFFEWHGFIEKQRLWRAPRFARWIFKDHTEERVFKLVEFVSGATVFSGELKALTLVRDRYLPNDYISPLNVVDSLNLVTGAGKLKFKFVAYDNYGRDLTANFVAEVFTDVGTTSTLVETVSAGPMTIGAVTPIGFDNEFTVEFAFTQAFRSDDPARGPNSPVGFVASRVKVTGTLTVADGSDPGWVHTDFEEIYLVQEKKAPTIEPFIDISTFSLDQVTSQLALTPTEARFPASLIVVVQDRTVASRSFDWPPSFEPKLEGLVVGYIPASGIFGTNTNAPVVKIWQPFVDAEYSGFRVELNSGPIFEDPSISPNLPQRVTYYYDIIFDATNDAFAEVTTVTPQYPRIKITAADRSGNKVEEFAQLKLMVDAAPYMRDGATAWLSIDTRVLKVKQAEVRFGTPLGSNPNTFITNAINNLNDGLSPESFDSLPQDQPGSVLEFSQTINGAVWHNFAIAKVRLQGVSGATNVRAFFRLFSYTATNLVFDTATGYRTYSSGANSIPLYGYASTAAGASTNSIPFFASPRVPFTSSATSQTDPLNVKNFPAGFATEQVIYFGVYLDINQPNAKVPAALILGNPDGPFAASQVQPIKNIIKDAHQCMVVQIQFAGNPTVPGDTPESSSNLAQRNLMILETDNPGSLPTHTIQHSFHVDLRKVITPNGNFPWFTPRLITHTQRDSRLKQLRMQLAWAGDNRTDPVQVMKNQFPLVYDFTSDARTTEFFDELMIRWPRNPSLPVGTTAEIYLPNIAAADIINLRNVRHAPNDVRIVDSHTLSVNVAVVNNPPSTSPPPIVPGKYVGTSYIPIPYQDGDKTETAGIITIYLPDGIVEGQKWTVDVVQIRGSTHQVLGGFQVRVNTTKARHGKMLPAETALLDLLHQRVALTPKDDIWYKVLQKRERDVRIRCITLAITTDAQFNDPTVTGRTRVPFVGRKIRVVLDQVRFGGRSGNSFSFRSFVETNDNEYAPEQRVYPAVGGLPATSCNTVWSTSLVMFEGYISTHLYVSVRATKTVQQLPTYPTTPACGCDAFCHAGQKCLQSVCTASTAQELPIYGKLLTGDVANFVRSYNSAEDVPDNLKDWGLSWHIEYM